MVSENNRTLQLHRAALPQVKKWRACFRGLSCFGSEQKCKTRIVPASRTPEVHASSTHQNGDRVPNQANGNVPSLYAPPSSPASFTNSGLQSTAQSPGCSLSGNSPNMFVQGPYANETQLVSPPVFSTFTTEPSTAPLTPPPELTNPSSPDVPYARFLSSSAAHPEKMICRSSSDLQATYYPLYTGSPASSTLASPVSTAGDSSLFTDKERDFFCPETFAQFYLDQSSVAHPGGRLSISRDSDAHPNCAAGFQNRQGKADEVDAYRESFGFSADELTADRYVE
ncbi:hypothetical protein M569_16031, partial [Genlisea aurea]